MGFKAGSVSVMMAPAAVTAGVTAASARVLPTAKALGRFASTIGMVGAVAAAKQVEAAGML
jgi:hypothetical protein